MKQSSKTLIKILIILLLYFLTQALVMTVFAAIGGMGVQGDIQGAMTAYLEEKALLITLVHNVLVIFCLLIYRRRNAAAKQELVFKRLPVTEAAQCLGAGACFAFTVSMLLALLPIPEELLSTYSSTVTEGTSGTPLEKLLSIAFVAPIAEELLFRGAIYGSFKRTSRPIIAIAASCALFGLMHQDPIWIIYAFLMGLGLTLGLDAYGTLLAPIMLHMGFNLAGYFVAPILEGITLYAVLIAIAGCVLFIRHARTLPKYQGDKQ